MLYLECKVVAGSFLNNHIGCFPTSFSWFLGCDEGYDLPLVSTNTGFWLSAQVRH